MLGPLRPIAFAGQIAALALVLTAAAAAARVQPLHERLRRSDTRWASNLRDLANVVVGALCIGALVVAGLPPSAALLWGGTAFIVAEALRHLELRPRVRGVLTGCVVVAMLGSAVLAPASTLALMERTAAALMPGHSTGG